MDFSRPPTVPDVSFIDDTFVFGDLIEPLGFDSIWSTEHFGTAYSMQPNILQWLAYWAARTERVDIGTAVVVVPWWNPVRLAHELAMLDIMLKGRELMVGLGRGVSEHEYSALGVSREHSREIFYETLDILRLADTQERFSYDGKFFQVPPTSIRPQARHRGHLLDNVRVATGTRRSMEMAAEAGLGLLFVANEPLSDMAAKVADFNEMRKANGFGPDHGTAVLYTYCAATKAEVAKGHEFLVTQAQASRLHYFEWNNSGFEGVAGYEEYAEKLSRGTDDAKELVENEASQLIGTPDQLIEKIQTIQKATGLGYLILHINYGGMDLEQASNSLKLFAKEVLPAVHAMDITAETEPAKGQLV
jgi:alkanesulfonate monooxygenase SsuD/methylene tetrahydromethanopterin reductase-like flavin-dependent oxidoreductase (luciferase family)